MRSLFHASLTSSSFQFESSNWLLDSAIIALILRSNTTKATSVNTESFHLYTPHHINQSIQGTQVHYSVITSRTGYYGGYLSSIYPVQTHSLTFVPIGATKLAVSLKLVSLH